jgi:predicted permease
MLIIGMAVEVASDKAMLRETAREIVIRYALATVFALAIYFLAPLDLLIRQVMVVICFSPISSLAPVYTERCHSDTAMAGFTNSVSIAVSLVIMLGLSMAFIG